MRSSNGGWHGLAGRGFRGLPETSVGLRADDGANSLSDAGSPLLLQTYVWQNYDLFPKFPALKDFLSFWEKELDGPLFSVTVAHSKLIKPAELRTVDGVFRLH